MVYTNPANHCQEACFDSPESGETCLSNAVFLQSWVLPGLVWWSFSYIRIQTQTPSHNLSESRMISDVVLACGCVCLETHARGGLPYVTMYCHFLLRRLVVFF